MLGGLLKVTETRFEVPPLREFGLYAGKNSRLASKPHSLSTRREISLRVRRAWLSPYFTVLFISPERKGKEGKKTQRIIEL